jgi:hypothetical protein
VIAAPQAVMRAPVPRDVRLLLIAVILTGCSAALVEMPALWIVTPMVALTILAGVRARNGAAASAIAGVTLPPAVQQAIDRAFTQLPDGGTAERLLLDVVRHASPLFDARDSAFDAAHDELTRANASELVVACCDVALQLSQVDGLRAEDIRAAQDATQREATRVKYDATYKMLVLHLSNAADALAALYVSGVEHGTPASERVAALVSEIKLDASARSAAAAEMAKLV